jgi:glycosyltransferase involved in cell wall biosynthesis
MPDAELIDTIHRKFTAVLMDLDERGTRRWAAAEAMAIGRGGITVVAAATGLARSTIQNGGNVGLAREGSLGSASSRNSVRRSKSWWPPAHGAIRCRP